MWASKIEKVDRFQYRRNLIILTTKLILTSWLIHVIY